MQYGATSGRYSTYNAPFGTHDTPKTRVKIIGGKMVTIIENGGFYKPMEQSSQQQSNKNQRQQQQSRIDAPPSMDSISTKPNQYDPNKWIVGERAAGIKTEKDQEIPSTNDRYAFSPHPILPPIETNVDINTLVSLDRMPDKPIHLNYKQELELRKRIMQDLTNVDPKVLKSVYLQFTEIDRTLSGYVSFDDLSFILLKNQLPINEKWLRLISAVYMLENTQSTNYEKVLAFISSSLKQSRQPLQLEPDRNRVNPDVYNNPITHQTEDFSPLSNRFPYGDRDNAKLLSVIETQMLSAQDDINFESIWQTFRSYDPQFRGKLSKYQIIDIAMKCRLPLQQSVIEQILNRVERSYGQYNWIQFLEFIERVIPLKTGLFIPDSKKPKEFFKTMPQPNSSWPMQETATAQVPNVVRQEEEDELINMKKLNYDNQIQMQQDQQQQQNSQQTTQTNFNYPDSKPISEGFIQLSKALYNSDIDKTQSLTLDSARWIINQYNSTYDLGLDSNKIENILYQSLKSNAVNVDNLIEKLRSIIFE